MEFRRILQLLSGVLLWSAAAATALTVLAGMAIDAEAFGARDFGLALVLSVWRALGLVVLTWAAPVLIITGAAAWFADRKAGVRLMSAGMIACVPVITAAWVS